MQTPRKPPLAETLLVGLLFLIFFQLLTDFIAAIYALGLIGVDIPPEIASALLLFSPVILVFLRKPPGRRALVVLVLLVLLCRGMDPLLPTRERMLVAGLGVGSFLVLLPLWVARQRRLEQSSGLLAFGLAIGLTLAVLLRAAGSGVDPSTAGSSSLVAGAVSVGLALLAGVLLVRRPAFLTESPAVRDEPSPAGSFWRTAGLAIGLMAALALLYFAFAAPNVIARWAEAEYLLVLALISAALAAFAVLFGERSPWRFLLTPGVLLAWNLLFVLCLVLTLGLHQVRFPPAPAAYPFYAPPAPAWRMVPFVFTLLLFPVVLVDFALFSREIARMPLSSRRLGAGFTLASLFLLLLIFAHVFTTVYDYIPVAGPAFRDRFGLVYLAAGLGMVLPLGLIRWKRGGVGETASPVSAAAPVQSILSPTLFPLVLAAAGAAAVLLAAVTAPRPAAPSSEESRLRVLTYNIQQGYDALGQKNYTGQLELIRQLNVDILGLQESDTNRIAGSNDDLVRYLADHLEMYSYYGPSPVAGTFGIALLSRVPIENPRTFFMYSRGEQTAAILAQVTKAGRTFNVLVTHLGNGGPLVQQEAVLKELMDKQDVIAMGDFNFTPDEAPYLRTVDLLADAWLLRWPGGVQEEDGEHSAGFDPARRIDHIFVSPGISAREARYLTGPESDHPALFVELAW